MNDVLSHIFSFVGEENYIYICPVSKLWNESWKYDKSTRALSNGNAESQFKESIENGITRSPYIVECCVRMNRLDLVKICKNYFHLSCFDNICYSAACQGNMDIIVWAKNNNIPFGTYTCDVLFFRGRYNILKWAIENGEGWRGSCFGFWNFLDGRMGSGGEYESMIWLIENKYVYDVV